MKSQEISNSNAHLDKLFDSFNGISEENNEGIIEFVESNFDYLINYKTDDITIIEDISSILNEYFGTLGLCSHWTEIIKRKDTAFDYISQLKGKSDKFEKHFYDLEYIYSSALIEQGNDYKSAIVSLESLAIRFPKDEEIIWNLTIAKYQLRQKVYKLIYILVLVGIVCAVIIGFVFIRPEIKLIGNILLIALVLILIIAKVDHIKSYKIPRS